MAARLIIRVHPDDRVEVKVEGMAGRDASRPKGKKLCEQMTKRLERDLGKVISRRYDDDRAQELKTEVFDQTDQQLGNMG